MLQRKTKYSYIGTDIRQTSCDFGARRLSRWWNGIGRVLTSTALMYLFSLSVDPP